MTETGLRERKKRATRDALIEVALDLFISDGVDATSVDQIAERVDVSARTFHRYFASKDDVLFADAEDRRRMVAEVLATRPDDEPILDGLRAGALALVNATQPRAAEQARKLQIIESSDRLRARSLRGSEELADVFAAHVAMRLGEAAEDARARLLGAWALGAIRTSHRRWLADPRLDLAAEVDAAFTLLADLPDGLRP